MARRMGGQSAIQLFLFGIARRGDRPDSRLSIGPSKPDTWPSACGKVVAMRCTKCGTESTTGRKFCAACGSSLSSRCPKCGAENAPASVFYEDCGSALAVNATPAATHSLQTGSTAHN